MATQTLPISSKLSNTKYTLQKVLGQGGFGITYLANNTYFGNQVALKEFFMKNYCERDSSSTSIVSVSTSEEGQILVAKFKQKFLNEATTLFHLNHPRIIKILDIFEENDTAYYVMEYISTGSLKDYVKKQNRLSEKRTLELARQIASALAYIHERRILHLDIKPDNIMMRGDNDLVIIDFGISKRYDEAGTATSSTPAGVSKGYAPLEQYKQGGIMSFSPATDIYSLGATMLFMLTGETPPDANSILDDGMPQRPEYISEQTYAAISHAMEPKRRDRPQSIDEFLKLLPKDVEDEVETIEPEIEITVEDEGTDLTAELMAAEKKKAEEAAAAKKKAEEAAAAKKKAEEAAAAKKKAEEAAAAKKRAEEAAAAKKRAEEAAAKKKVEEAKSMQQQKKKGGGTLKKIGIGVGAAMVLIVLIAIFSPSSDGAQSTLSSQGIPKITNGSIHLADGSVWTGEIDNMSPNGKGQLVYPQNDPDGRKTFDGIIKDGKRIEGVLIYMDGRSFDGTFIDGESFGKGKLTLDFGIFDGEFKNNHDYNGTWTDKNGKVLSTVTEGEGGYL